MMPVPGRRALAVIAGLAMAGLPAARAAGDVVAQYGSITLGSDDIRQLLANLDPAARTAVERNPGALTTLVRERLVQLALLQEARDKKWDQRPEVIAAANQAHDAVIASTYLASVSAADPAYPSDADIQTAYDANKTRFVVPRQYQLAQIFIAVPAGSAKAADDAARKKLLDLRTQASRPHADFAGLARQNSQDHASAANGGTIGWAAENALQPEIRSAVAGMQVDALSDPIRMADGWHLVKLLATRPASTAALADVKAVLVEALRKQRVQQNAQAYTAALLRAQPTQIDEIAVGKLLAK